MNKNVIRTLAGAMMLLMLTLISSVTCFAANEIDSEGGRSITVQDVSFIEGSGTVTIIRNGQYFAPAKGMRISEGDVIKTKGKAKVYLDVDSNMVLSLDEDTEAEVTKSLLGQKLIVNVKYGHMFYNVARQANGNEALELMANNVTIAIRGTSGILASGGDKLEHMLFDGVVEISDGINTIKQQPGEMISTTAGAGVAGIEIKEFTLEDIPKSMVEEMKKDADLMNRVLNSVPESKDENGKPVFMSAETFQSRAGSIGVSDKETFKQTTAAAESAGQSHTYSTSSSNPSSYSAPATNNTSGDDNPDGSGDSSPSSGKIEIPCGNESCSNVYSFTQSEADALVGQNYTCPECNRTFGIEIINGEYVAAPPF